MSVLLRRQIDKLKKMTLSLGGLVEQSLRDSLRALDHRDSELAARVVAGDNRIDALQREIEEECLATLALHQPVAFDLRYVVAILKMGSDLERIGDLAENIADQSQLLAEEDRVSEIPVDLPGMSSLVQTMLKKALDALVNMDSPLAQQVRATDDQVDALHRQTYDRVERGIREHPHQIEQHIQYMAVSRFLERIADHAVNIAEDVLYMADADFFKEQRQRDSGKSQPAKT